MQNIEIKAQEIDTTEAFTLMEEGKGLFEKKQMDQAGAKFIKAAIIYKELKLWERYEVAADKIVKIQKELSSFEPTEDLFTIEEVELNNLEKTDPKLLVLILLSTAKSYNYQRKFDDCKSIISQALELKRKHDPSDTTLLASMILVKSYACYYLGDFKKAAELVEESVQFEELYSKAKPINISNSYNNLSSIYARLYDFDNALKSAKKSLNLRKSNLPENDIALGQCYNNIALIYKMMGDYDNALIYFKKLTSLTSILYDKTHTTYINTFKNKATLLDDMGLHERSIEVLDYIISEQDMSTFVNHLEYPNILQNYGLNLKRLGRNQEALDTLLKSFELARKIPGFLNLARFESNLGMAYLEMGQHKEAIKILKNSIVRQKELMSDSPELGDFYGKLGLAYKKNGQYKKAEKYILSGLQNSIRILPKGHPYLLGLHNIYIELLNDQKQYSKTFDYSISTKTIAYGKFPALIAYYNLKLDASINILELTPKKEVIDSCYLWLNWGIEKIQLSKLTYLTQADRFAYQDEIFTFCETALDFIFQYGNDADKNELAFQIIEESKGFALLQNLRLKNTFYPEGVPRAIIDQESEQRKKIKYLDYKISQILDDTTSLTEARLTLLNYKESYSTLIEKINKEYPKFASIKFGPKNSSSEEIRALLDDDQALISFFEGSKFLYTLTINKEKTIFKKSIKEDDWEETIGLYRESIKQAYTQNEDESLFDKTLSISNKVYDLVLKDLLSELSSDTKVLTIIPDGQLNFISFESLIENDENRDARDYRKLNYLLNKYTISYAPSSTIWVESSNINNRNDKNYIGFGPTYKPTGSDQTIDSTVDPTIDLTINPSVAVVLRDGLDDLPVARKSVAAASKLFDGDSYIGEEASKENFLKHTNSYAILHLALHGIVDHKNPMMSKLVFTKTQKDSTSHWLNASDIYNVELDNQLSVLTACNTGIGELQKGEGVMSLSRAFGYAGSPSMMMSLWSIPDVQTADITNSFFKNLQSGDPKHTALRKAKLHYLENTPKSTAHPMFWSGFTISGNTNPIVLANQGVDYKYFTIFILLGLILFIIYKRKIDTSIDVEKIKQ